MKNENDGPASGLNHEADEKRNREEAERVYKTIVKDEVKYSWLMWLLTMVAVSFVMGILFTDYLTMFVTVPLIVSTLSTLGVVMYDKHIEKENRKQIQKYVDEHANEGCCQYLVMMYDERKNR